MAEASAMSSSHLTLTETIESNQTRSPNVVLKLHKPKSSKKVKWEEGTVDNEHLDKKKSKCCCIYEKPKLFGESSDEDDEDCTGNCHGHKKKCYQQLPPEENGGATAGPSS